ILLPAFCYYCFVRSRQVIILKLAVPPASWKKSVFFQPFYVPSIIKKSQYPMVRFTVAISSTHPRVQRAVSIWFLVSVTTTTFKKREILLPPSSRRMDEYWQNQPPLWAYQS